MATKRGARPNPPAEQVAPEFDAEKLVERSQQLAVMREVERAYGEDRDLVNQLLGQAQVADAFGKFSQTVWSSKLAHVKENKLYRALAGKQMPNGLEFSGTWEEFCRLLGVSDEKANQDIANLRVFGEEALESMSRMGIGYREMRQFRQLPSDSQEALIEAAKAGDKDGLLDLAEELIARQAKEKEELVAKAEAAEANYAAREGRVAELSNSNNELREQLSILPRLSRPKKAEKAMADFAAILSDARAHLRHAEQSMERMDELAAGHHPANNPEICDAAKKTAELMAGLLDGLSRRGITAPAQLVRDIIGG